ncbi:hypothetical protein E4U42_003332 [Claviceps africana]|uniref:6-phosphogluconate dehydrogenase n=1 Tax=Claviceps africana TaxID=83212 RepID=A0A8K0NLN2_9HYPO|nr:hypothetical protein E4U42_003332 [Claviceps africana]
MSLPEKSSTRVGVLSMGDMGAGIARLLLARGFTVVTNCQGRRRVSSTARTKTKANQDTIDRANAANVATVPSDLHLVQQCRVILSIVPPRDAHATAQRIADALVGGTASENESVFFVDLNAIAPSSARAMEGMFDKARVPVRFIDGCILGTPPRRRDDAAGVVVTDSLADTDTDAEWRRPRIPVSGPHCLSVLPDGHRLAEVLNMRSISDQVGAASGLKMCFAAVSKGFTALATQSFTTARRLGVAEDLRGELGRILPNYLATAERSVPDMPPKAYRWVREMEEVAETMAEEGGWTRELFSGVAGVYKSVAENDVLGKEKMGKRRRGNTIEDVASLMGEELELKKKKME